MTNKAGHITGIIIQVHHLKWSYSNSFEDGITISSGNGLPPVQHQAITCTNDDLLSIEPLRTNFNETLTTIQNFLHIQ